MRALGHDFADRQRAVGAGVDLDEEVFGAVEGGERAGEGGGGEEARGRGVDEMDERGADRFVAEVDICGLALRCGLGAVVLEKWWSGGGLVVDGRYGAGLADGVF